MHAQANVNIPASGCITMHVLGIPYISHGTMRHLPSGLRKACWLFEVDLGEGLRGYVPSSSYVSMGRCLGVQIPQNSRPDCGGWACWLSGPWRRGTPKYGCCNEA
jgi:hypothetical protein